MVFVFYFRFISVGDADNSVHVHKATVIRELNTNGFAGLSNDRLRRVRGYSKYPGVSSAAADELTEDVIVGDPCAVLVENCDKELTSTCLAIMLIDKIENQTHVTGKVLQLDTVDDSLVWERSMIRQQSIQSSLFVTLNPNYDLQQHKMLFTSNSLIEAYKVLITRMETEKIEIPKMKASCLPYDMEMISTKPEKKLVQPKTASTGTACTYCHIKVNRKKMRQHIGEHIISGKVPTSACGFCGKNDPPCESWVERSSGKGKTKSFGVGSKCAHFLKFNYKSAAKSTKNSPCTNRPVYCKEEHCYCLLWAYDFEAHYEKIHPDVAVPEDMKITEEERVLMRLKTR